MKLLFRDYLSSLREREELDAILPDLLSELGYTVFSRPQRGTSQAGVDVAAVLREDGERKVFLFTIKQGDITRQSWGGDSPQSLRASLQQILDNYLQNRLPKGLQGLKVVICIVFGGDVQEQVRADLTGFEKAHSTERISFDEWNGDKLAELLLNGILREELMPKETRSHFQKAVAMLEEPTISVSHFRKFAQLLTKGVDSDKSRVRVARQLFIATQVLFVWGRDADNLEAAYQASELLLLNIWELTKPHQGKSTAASRSIQFVLTFSIQLHLSVANEFLVRKVFPAAKHRDAIGMAVRSRTSVDVNLALFDLLGRIGLLGCWHWWLASLSTGDEAQELALKGLDEVAEAGVQLIRNNSALLLPLQDQHAIDIALFLTFLVNSNRNAKDVRNWLSEMVERLSYTVQLHGKYPCTLSDYSDLLAHPRARTDEYRKEALPGSILIPLLAAFVSALGDGESFEAIVSLKKDALKECTFQFWTPGPDTESRLYMSNGHDHGVALLEVSLENGGADLLNWIHEGCVNDADFEGLSAIKYNFWPIVLTACRHHRMPVPPHFWIGSIHDAPGSKTEEQTITTEESLGPSSV